jgi:DNA-binding transcriptional LysR family regulator
LCSDTLHPDVLEDLLQQFDRRFPHTEFECLIGEDEDVIDLLQKERAQVGLIEARDSYPTEIGSTPADANGDGHLRGPRASAGGAGQGHLG